MLVNKAVFIMVPNGALKRLKSVRYKWVSTGAIRWWRNGLVSLSADWLCVFLHFLRFSWMRWRELRFCHPRSTVVSTRMAVDGQTDFRISRSETYPLTTMICKTYFVECFCRCACVTVYACLCFGVHVCVRARVKTKACCCYCCFFVRHCLHCPQCWSTWPNNADFVLMCQ